MTFGSPIVWATTNGTTVTKYAPFGNYGCSGGPVLRTDALRSYHNADPTVVGVLSEMIRRDTSTRQLRFCEETLFTVYTDLTNPTFIEFLRQIRQPERFKSDFTHGEPSCQEPRTGRCLPAQELSGRLKQISQQPAAGAYQPVSDDFLSEPCLRDSMLFSYTVAVIVVGYFIHFAFGNRNARRRDTQMDRSQR
ncbi:MAG: hypothetical protein AAF355_03870 [Myxococcota bacterium]